MTGDEFIDVAGKLAANPGLGSQEARCRSAVSRAYYGVFHLAVEFLSEFDVDVKANHHGHQEAYRLLFQTRQPDAQMAARLLNDLRGSRNDADYKLDKASVGTTENARLQVENASQFSTFLANCREEPARSEIASSLASD